MRETLTNPIKRAVLLNVSADFECRCGTRFSASSDAEVIGEPSAWAYCPEHPADRYIVSITRLDTR